VSELFCFRPMTPADAEEIARWEYPEPYCFYDAAADAGDLAELLDPALRGEEYVSVDDGSGALVGFFQFEARPPDAIEIGLGLHPDLTGRGLGSGFLETGLQEARGRFGPVRIVLAVATFNRRAIRVYERAGFTPVRTYIHATNGGEWEFLEMELRGR
jgi:[ribosomal protein S18]-alanine N-acetyltransferase